MQDFFIAQGIFWLSSLVAMCAWNRAIFVEVLFQIVKYLRADSIYRTERTSADLLASICVAKLLLSPLQPMSCGLSGIA